MALVLGVDCSTQSCSVEARDLDSGERVGFVTTPLPLTYPPLSEHDPHVWWQALKEDLTKLSSAGVDLADAVALSVSGQCHGLVPLDEAGQVIRPAKLWNDTTTASQMEHLLSVLTAEEWVQQVGVIPNPAFTISKLAWLVDNEPETIERLAQILLPHDYLTYRLTGKYVTDRSEASGTGYYAAHENRYLPELLDKCFGPIKDWNELFPQVLGPDDVAGVIQADVAKELGLPDSLKIAPGGGDQHIGAVGMGLRDGDIAYSLGTSGVVLASTSEPVFDSSGWVDGVCNATGGWLPLICTLNCMKVTDNMAELLGVDVKTLDEMALQVDASAPRPVMAPFLDGERTPALPYAQGMLAGLTGGTTREHLALAAVEGVLLGLVRGQRALEATGLKLDGRVIVVGGGAKSAAFRQVLADLLQREVLELDTTETTVRGACVQAAAVWYGITVKEMRDRWQPKVTRRTSPRINAGWDGLIEKYDEVVSLQS